MTGEGHPKDLKIDHSPWVSLFPPQYLQPLLENQKLSLLRFSCQNGAQGQEERLPKWSRIDLQLNSAASVENI